LHSRQRTWCLSMPEIVGQGPSGSAMARQPARRCRLDWPGRASLDRLRASPTVLASPKGCTAGRGPEFAHRRLPLRGPATSSAATTRLSGALGQAVPSALGSLVGSNHSGRAGTLGAWLRSVIEWPSDFERLSCWLKERQPWHTPDGWPWRRPGSLRGCPRRRPCRARAAPGPPAGDARVTVTS
jgi:hypothetical protein